MNIFVLDNDLKKCAQSHCDKHVVKMILEYAQMLSTVVRESGIDAGYKATHKKHPCTLWASESLSNWLWLRDLAEQLNEEYRYRYEKDQNHKSFDMILSLPIPPIHDIGLTPFALAMPDKYKCDNPIQAYRNYYIHDKKDIVSWKKRKQPRWYENERQVKSVC